MKLLNSFNCYVLGLIAVNFVPDGAEQEGPDADGGEEPADEDGDSSSGLPKPELRLDR